MLGATLRFSLLLVFVSAIPAVPLAAAEPARLFAETIQPVLKESCLGCHGEANTFANLDLRTREAMLKGGLRGPAVSPGAAEDSLLYQAVEHQNGLEMPPGTKLPESVREAFRAWIDAGAPFSPVAAAAPRWDRYDDADLWAFRPVQKVEPPEISGARTPVDAFILRKLRERGLEPAPRADRRTLIRRAAVDLTGLPPTPAEVEAFLDDPTRDAEAFAKVIDRLLASPRYGERWGRHWLDVVRYADTAGYSNDFERPNAWRYRDYVIRAFNNDKPYDRFILEQVAGDELFPYDPEALIATGFLRTGPWEHTAMSVAAETRQMWLDDVTHSTISSFLGLTMGCARCHDHKFDPLPQKDYYRVQAVFASTAFARRPVPFLASETHDGFEEGKRRMSLLIQQVDAKLKEYDELNKKRLLEKYNVANLQDLPEGVGRQSGLTPAEKEAQKLYQKHLSIHKLSAQRYNPFAFSVSSGLLEGCDDITPGGQNSYLKKEDYENAATFVLAGGSIQAPGEPVTPGGLSVIERYSELPAPEIPDSVAGRRAALARWIADRRNPLTARVMANRIWQYHFGRGVADNASNFGKMGEKPTHPELLDWLAAHFMAHGWSVKRMHRAIMLTDTYMRSSRHPEPASVEAKDVENTLLAFYPPRRVEAEVIRDAMLAVSGELSGSAGGPGTYPRINRDVADQPRHAMGSLRPAYYAEPSRNARNRRSIYSFQQRSLIDPAIEVFNGPPLDLSCERRDATTVPTQAFTLFNSELSYSLAAAFAARLVREASSEAELVQRAFELAFGRPPAKQEKELALAHLARMRVYHERTPPPPKPQRKPLVRSITSELTGEMFRFEEERPPWEEEPDLYWSDLPPETRAIADLALTLFNANEFVYLH